VDAISRLHRWIHDLKIVPANSSIEPGAGIEPDWVFARHWYSTWIDYKLRKDEAGKPLVKIKNEAVYGVARIPISKEYLDDQVALAKTRHRKPNIEHHSAWGEWYLTIQRGSENVELGIDLINNLMTARKVSERA
jgi:hypothetical protein